MNQRYLLNTLKIVAIPVLYALALRLFFGIHTWRELFDVMSVSFLFLLPFIVGVLTVYLSKLHLAKENWYKVFMPWLPIFVFFILTLALAIEGWACWLMVLPLFLIASSVGGFIGGYLKIKHSNKKGNLYISVFIILPLVFSPIENWMGKIPGTYKAYTFIDIDATAPNIWQHVTRVKEIAQEDDQGYLTQALGFPRPVRAELNYNGIGAHREAIFTNGLVFHENVLAYQDQKKMVFTIKANPHEIPSTTLDEHVVIGGAYFDVLKGTYELEQLTPTSYRLHLYSHFKLTTTFNFYASWWARWIMQDIQNNIIKVIKKRAEQA